MKEEFPATLRRKCRKCLVCGNMDLEMRYRKRKMESFTKRELADRHKESIDKLRDEDDYSDGLSEKDDNSNDEDFIPSTPQQKKIKSSIRKEDKKSKRPADNDNSITDHQNQDKPENPIIEEDNKSERELDSEQSQQESDQESSTIDKRDGSGENFPFSRYYKSYKWFYPGNTLN